MLYDSIASFHKHLSAYCVPGLMRGWDDDDALIRPVLALQKLPVRMGEQTGKQIICSVLKLKRFF